MKKLRLTMSVIGRISPKLAASAFIYFFTRPARRVFRHHHLTLKAAAKEGELQLTTYAFSQQLVNIKTYTWGTGEKQVLLLHGWGSSALDFGHLISLLTEQGYQVISFDQPAHGFSGGKSTNLVQWIHIERAILQQYPSLYAIIGHSLGGLSAVLSLAREQQHVPRVAVVAPSISAPVFFEETFDQLGLSPKTRIHVPRLIQQRVQEELGELDMNKYFSTVQQEKFLFVYDETDEVIAPRYAEDFLQQHPEVEVLKIKGEGHYRIMKDPQVLTKLIGFLK